MLCYILIHNLVHWDLGVCFQGQLGLSCNQHEGVSEFTDVWKELKQRETFSPDKKEPDITDIDKPCDNQEGNKSMSEREFNGRRIDRSPSSFAEV